MRKFHWRALIETAESPARARARRRCCRVLPPVSDRTELQDVVYDAAPQIRHPSRSRRRRRGRRARARDRGGGRQARALLGGDRASRSRPSSRAGCSTRPRRLSPQVRGRPPAAADVLLDQADGQILLARGEYEPAAASCSPRVTAAAAERDFRLVELRARTCAPRRSPAAAAASRRRRALRDVVRRGTRGRRRPDPRRRRARGRADGPDRRSSGGGRGTRRRARRRGRAARDLAVRRRPRLHRDRRDDATGRARRPARRPAPLGRRGGPPPPRLRRQVRRRRRDGDVQRHPAPGSTTPQHALEAALALSGKASLLDLGVGIGIAVGPAVVAQRAPTARTCPSSVRRRTSPHGSRRSAGRGEVVLSDEAYRRVADWLSARGLDRDPRGARAQGLRRRAAGVALAAA